MRIIWNVVRHQEAPPEMEGKPGYMVLVPQVPDHLGNNLALIHAVLKPSGEALIKVECNDGMQFACLLHRIVDKRLNESIFGVQR